MRNFIEHYELTRIYLFYNEPQLFSVADECGTNLLVLSLDEDERGVSCKWAMAYLDDKSLRDMEDQLLDLWDFFSLDDSMVTFVERERGREGFRLGRGRMADEDKPLQGEYLPVGYDSRNERRISNLAETRAAEPSIQQGDAHFYGLAA